MNKKISLAILLCILTLLLAACQTITVLPPRGEMEFFLQYEGENFDTYVSFQSDAGEMRFNVQQVRWIFDRSIGQREYALLEIKPVGTVGSVEFHLLSAKGPTE